MDCSHPLARNFKFWFPLNFVDYVNVKRNHNAVAEVKDMDSDNESHQSKKLLSSLLDIVFQSCMLHRFTLFY